MNYLVRRNSILNTYMQIHAPFHFMFTFDRHQVETRVTMLVNFNAEEFVTQSILMLFFFPSFPFLFHARDTICHTEFVVTKTKAARHHHGKQPPYQPCFSTGLWNILQLIRHAFELCHPQTSPRMMITPKGTPDMQRLMLTTYLYISCRVRQLWRCPSSSHLHKCSLQ